jgi:hypothetical protein
MHLHDALGTVMKSRVVTLLEESRLSTTIYSAAYAQLVQASFLQIILSS